jgi:hypothetical protein
MPSFHQAVFAFLVLSITHTSALIFAYPVPSESDYVFASRDSVVVLWNVYGLSSIGLDYGITTDVVSNFTCRTYQLDFPIETDKPSQSTCQMIIT